VPNTANVTIQDRSISPRANQRKESVDYVVAVVRELGFAVEVQQWQQSAKVKKGSGEVVDVTYRNVVVTVPGFLPVEEQQVIIVGAHHDTQNSLSSCWHGSKDKGYLPTVGADDNTSGVVGCLVLLHRIKHNGLQLAHTLKIVLFDGEEPGIINSMATGSLYYVESLTRQQRHNTKLALIIDMIGAPPTVPGIGLVISASDNAPIFEVITSISEIKGNNSIPVTIANYEMNIDLSCLTLSDSCRFNSEHIPTLLLCNVAGYISTPDFYHTEDDTMSVLDWPTFFRAVDVAEAIVIYQNQS